VHKIEHQPTNDNNQTRDKGNWGEIDKQWTKQGGNSVHTLNEDNDIGNTAYAKTTFKQGGKPINFSI